MTDLRRFATLLRRYLRPHWRAVAVLVATSYLAAALTALFPAIMAPILDLALGSAAGAPSTDESGVHLGNLGALVLGWLGIDADAPRLRAIVALCLAYVAIGLGKGLLDFGNYLLALWIRVRAGATMQLDLFRHLLGLSMSFFNRQRTGELVARLDADTRATTAGLETIVVTALTAPVLLAFYGFLMVGTSPVLVVAALGAAGLHYGLTAAIRGPVRRHLADQYSAFAELVARFQETILSIRVVKTFGAERFELARLGRAIRQATQLTVKFGAYKHVEEPTRSVVNTVIEASIIVVAAYELLAGRLAAPTFFLFLYVGRAAMTQIGVLGGAYTQMQSALAASTRVGELFALVPAVPDGSEPIHAFGDRLALQDVSFDYGGERVLDGVTLEIRKGRVVALVGPSGAGKSTLADLLLRLYDPTRGVVTIDGRDLRTLRHADYRRLFGVVAQDALLLNGTIRENITYGRDGLGEADIVRAARIANAHDFIREFPDGYDTLVGDRGVRLSGGQRQRIAIARAVVATPQILILDEATSSLDSEAERLVQQAIDQAIRGATSIIIAHRLSTIVHADRIVVVNRGRLEAVGRHAELLAGCETYRRLYQAQFAEAESIGRL